MPSRERPLAAVLEVRQEVSEAFGRRVLTPDLVDGLIREWKLHTRNGKSEIGLRQIGELHIYLGWTEHELQEYRMNEVCPQEDPIRSGRHLRSVG